LIHILKISENFITKSIEYIDYYKNIKKIIHKVDYFNYPVKYLKNILKIMSFKRLTNIYLIYLNIKSSIKFNSIRKIYK